MSGAVVTMMSKTQLVSSFTQGPGQAVDAGNFVNASIQVWVYGLAGSDSLDVYLEQSTLNEDDAYVDYQGSAGASGAILSINSSGGNSSTAIANVDGFARFLRLRLDASNVTSNQYEVRAQIILRTSS